MTDIPAPASAETLALIADFRREVKDKLSVVSHRGLQAGNIFRQCEDFLVEQFESGLHTLEAEVTALRAQLAASEAQVTKLKRAVDGHPSAQTIQRAITMIENSYKVSEVGDDHEGFPSKLENYIHQIYKREPKVQALAAQLTQARAALVSAGIVLRTLNSLGGLGFDKHRWIEDALVDVDAAQLAPADPETK